MNPEKVLPPGVNGKITGYLMVKVDEVFWARNSPGEVFVQLQWWGEKDSTLFRPEDITFNDPKKSNNTTMTYNIKTSPGLFESYLRNCNRITFTVLRGQNKNVILGTAVVKDVEQIISLKKYHSYFSIFSPKGNRIGDLHICFELNFKHIGTHFTLKHIEESSKPKSQYIIKPQNHYVEDQQSTTKSKSVSSQEDKLLSNILQKGHDLRKAMVLSVLADCPIDNLESVVNFNQNSEKHHSKIEETKLVDFLLGKCMTAEEEMKALETLRCTSPAENLVEIAKQDLDTSKVIKSKCCLHGQECSRKSSEVETKERKGTPASLETSSTHYAKNIPKPEEKVQHVEAETIVKKKSETKFNCYRIVISTLKLSVDGSRKIVYMPCIKQPMKHSIKFGRNHNPPGTFFILEVTLPSKAGGAWSRSFKFITKNFKGHCVDFSQGSTHRLCGTVGWNRIRSLLIGTVFTVYWRHLNQRVPCPLGSAKLEELNPEASADSISIRLPVYSNTRLLTGYLNMTICLGTLENLGEEAVFHTEKKTDNNYENIEDHYSFSSEVSEKVDPELQISSMKSSSPVISCSDDVFPAPVSSLDEELLRTIDLLNSKPDGAPEKNLVIERHEACVQTTLPLTSSPCHCEKNTKEDINETWFVNAKNDDLTKNQGKKKDDVKPKSSAYEGRMKNNSEYSYHEHHRYEDHFHPHMEFSCTSKDSGIPFLPIEFENETIHEFTVKIEKVVGIPLFTGDNDLDCYVDYSFPKVDYKGKIVFDHITNGTDIRMALRETEFGTAKQHRLRLHCKLTKALLSLPIHEITFSIWGRYYRPPRDYKMGKASVPLMRLSTLELVYCQQIKREPIFERIVIPISVVESSVTSGYKGSFGELHVILGYSCASNDSYKQWRKQCSKDQYYFHQASSKRNRSKNEKDIPDNHFKEFSDDKNDVLFPVKLKPDSQFVQNYRINVRNGSLNTPEFIQSNLITHNISNFKTIDNQRYENVQDCHLEVSKEKKKIRTLQNIEYDNSICDVLQPKDPSKEVINDNKSQNNDHEHNHFNSEITSIDPPRLGNVIEEVLLDIKERQVDKTNKPKSPVHTIPSNPQSEPLITDLSSCRDAFESFNLRVDLPSTADSVDFEVRSQYSFLCSPPPNQPLLSNERGITVLESDSSGSINDRIQKGNPVNPFSSLSNMSFSINSDSSMFKMQQPVNQLYLTKDGKKFEKNISPIDEQVEVEGHSSMSEKMYAGRSLNQENNSEQYQKNKTIQKNSYLNSDSEKNNVSSNGTLKSVESLKSYKEDLGGRRSKDIGVETEFLTQHKDTQTSYTSYKEEKYFKARVQLCRALGLPSVEVRLPNGKISMVKPTSYAYFSARVNGQQKILKTEIVEKKSNPIWNVSWNVEFPVEFLKKCDRELEIFVDLSGGSEEPVRGSNCSSHWPIVLRTGVDLTPITAGLEHASGWFSLSDRALLSRAQLKVIVTPLEDVSRFRDDWLKEYTKAKGRNIDFNVPHSSSIANSLQEKLKELEKLTERMRTKMDDRPNWNSSPPYNLLSEVKAVQFTNDQTDIQPVERWSGTVHTVETATSPIVYTSDSNCCSPFINITEVDEEKSILQTYTVEAGSESSQHDSLETPSETIDRILTKMRTKR